jgi:signal transduction histidine kinase
MQEDQTKLKNIRISSVFIGFENLEFEIFTDQKRLQQILLNLVSNAIKYTARGGAIKIICELVSIGQGKKEVRVSVTDNGTGIKEDD